MQHNDMHNFAAGADLDLTAAAEGDHGAGVGSRCPGAEGGAAASISDASHPRCRPRNLFPQGGERIRSRARRCATRTRAHI